MTEISFMATTTSKTGAIREGTGKVSRNQPTCTETMRNRRMTVGWTNPIMKAQDLVAELPERTPEQTPPRPPMGPAHAHPSGPTRAGGRARRALASTAKACPRRCVALAPTVGGQLRRGAVVPGGALDLVAPHLRPATGLARAGEAPAVRRARTHRRGPGPMGRHSSSGEGALRRSTRTVPTGGASPCR